MGAYDEERYIADLMEEQEIERMYDDWMIEELIKEGKLKIEQTRQVDEKIMIKKREIKSRG